MSTARETIPAIVTHQPSLRALGFFVACAISLFLSALALGAVVCWADWFGTADGTRPPELMTIVVLGNVGGNAGSVRGNPEGTNEPPPLPRTLPEVIKPATPIPAAAKPVVTVDDVKRSVAEAQQWLARTTPQLPSFALPEVSVEIPTLPTEAVAEAWTHAAAWTAKQLPRLKKPEPKKVPQAPPPRTVEEKKPEPAKSIEKKTVTATPRPLESPKQVPVEKQANPTPRGNAEQNGNNRSGSGNLGSGSNNNGADVSARLHASNIAPPYPDEADRLNLEGTVKVLVEYDPTGRITRASLYASSGSSLLDDPVVDYIRSNWTRVYPRQSSGRAVSGSLIVPFVYRKK